MSLQIRNAAERIRERLEAGGEMKGFYALSLKRFHKKNGNVVVPDDEGFFMPKDEEEAEILAHHLEQGRVSLDVPSEE